MAHTFMLKPLASQMCACLSVSKFSSPDKTSSQQRNKEAKKSSETDTQRTSNIKEAGTIGKRFFLVITRTHLHYDSTLECS